jgi:hypothetical protein
VTGHAVDAGAQRVFVATGNHGLGVYDVTSRVQMASWHVCDGAGDGALDVAYESSHARLVVGCQTRLDVLDASTGATISSHALDGIHHIAIANERREVFVPLVAKSLLVVLRLEENGALTITRVHRAPAADTVAAARDGTAIMLDWYRKRMLIVAP